MLQHERANKFFIHASPVDDARNPAKKEYSMGIKTNEDWLRALTASGPNRKRH
jgi:hypothetical protein